MDFGKLAKQAKKLLDEKGDKIAAGVDKATDVVDKKTGGKHTAKLAKVDGLAAKLDKTRPAPAGPPEAAGEPVDVRAPSPVEDGGPPGE